MALHGEDGDIHRVDREEFFLLKMLFSEIRRHPRQVQRHLAV